MLRGSHFLLAFVLLLILPVARTPQPPAGQAAIADAHPKSGKPPGNTGPSTEKMAANSAAFDAAMTLYRRGEFAEASFALQNLTREGGETAAKSWAWLARTNLRLYKVPEAEKAARKSLDLAPDLPTAHSALGEVYFRQGRFVDAEREFLTPLKAGLPDARSYYGEARLSWATSNYKHAKQLIAKAQALDPQDREILDAWMGTLPRPERIKYLESSLDSAEKMDPEEKKNWEAHLKRLLEREGRSAATCRLANQAASSESRLERLMYDASYFRGFALKVKLNDTSSRLMLDTGARGIVVNTKIAERAGLRKVADMAVKGVGNQGAASGYIAYADSIQVGGLEFQGCYVDVVDKKRSLDEDGLIGSDVFENYLVEVNFPDEKFKLTELPRPPDADQQPLGLTLDPDVAKPLHDRYIPPELKSYEKFYRFGHDILLPTLVNTTGNSKLFLVDTGSYSVHLSSDLARQVTRVHNDEYTILKGLSGTVKYVYRADSVKLAFGRFGHPAEDVVAFDMSDICNDTGTEVSGILGFSLLWLLDMKIDYRDGLIGFEYDPNRIR